MTYKIKTILLAGTVFTFAGTAFAEDLPPLNSDEEADRVEWSQLETQFGAIPAVPEGTSVAGVSKTLTNEYWRSLGIGYENMGKAHDVSVAYQAAPTEGDQLAQLSMAENMILQGYSALLLSPQTDNNLQPALESATAQGIPVVNVNDAVIPTVAHYVGNVQRDNGVRVAQWFIDHTEGGKVAVIEGQPGVFAAGQRTDGFTATISEAEGFDVVASVPANWSREEAYNAASTILQQHPDLIGFYANNDGMALGVVEAVAAAGKKDQIAVFGTDGISDAYNSIREGGLTGTVDSFPILTGEVAMEVALRLIGGQDIPRVVSTPQALITSDNIDTFAVSDQAVLRETLLKQ
jgi:ribose transport system substrate-binding protein